MKDAEGLIDELDQWPKAGRTFDVWWRDDDATQSSPALIRLTELGETA